MAPEDNCLPVDHGRQGDDGAARGKRFHQRARIDFRADRPEARDNIARMPADAAGMIGKRSCRVRVMVGGQRIAPGKRCGTDSGLVLRRIAAGRAGHGRMPTAAIGGVRHPGNLPK